MCQWLQQVAIYYNSCKSRLSVHLNQNTVLAVIHNIIKYISNQEASLHWKILLVAAVRKAMEPTSESDTDIGKKIILETSNKIDSHIEVGVPKAVSHRNEFGGVSVHNIRQLCAATHDAVEYTKECSGVAIRYCLQTQGRKKS